MIARIWRGATPASKADAYVPVLDRTGVKELHGTPGNLGVWVLRRIAGEKAEFVVLSLWDSLDSIRAFTGDDVERAVFYPEDDDFLSERDPTVAHYEAVIARPGTGPNSA